MSWFQFLIFNSPVSAATSSPLSTLSIWPHSVSSCEKRGRGWSEYAGRDWKTSRTKFCEVCHTGSECDIMHQAICIEDLGLVCLTGKAAMDLWIMDYIVIPIQCLRVDGLQSVQVSCLAPS